MQELTIGQATIQRVTTIDTKGGGYAILLTTTNNIDDDVLVALMRGRGSVMKVTMERLQQALMDGDDVNAGLPPVTERVFETASGDVVRAHVYESTSGDERCDHCGHGTGHDAHQVNPPYIATRGLSAQETAEAVDVLAARLVDDAQKDAADASITLEQAEARTALASRSRSARNGQ